MKTPTRKFIVEFKSGRRQQTQTPTSIWGDADLKAVAREVEDQLPQLFGPTETPGQLNSEVVVQSQPIHAEHSSKLVTERPAQQETVLDPVAEFASERLANEAPVPDVVLEREAVAVSVRRPRKAPSRHGKKRATTIGRNTRMPSAELGGNEGGSAVLVSATASADEIAALESENFRLRGLLISRLRVENIELARMLNRFG